MQNIYLLKDLARESGHSVHTIKFYLKRGLIRETGRSQGTRFRYFDDTTLAALSEIRHWRKQRKGLTEIQHLLNNSGRHDLLAQGSGLRAGQKSGSGLWAAGSGPSHSEPRAQNPEPLYFEPRAPSPELSSTG